MPPSCQKVPTCPKQGCLSSQICLSYCSLSWNRASASLLFIAKRDYPIPLAGLIIPSSRMAWNGGRRCLFLSVESGFHEAGSLLQALRAARHAILGNFTMLGNAVLVRRPARCTPCASASHRSQSERPSRRATSFGSLYATR